MEKQTTFAPVENIEDTIQDSFLGIDDVELGDKVIIIKKDDRPIVWVEDVEFENDDGSAKTVKVYKCYIKKSGQELEMKLNSYSRKTIFKTVGKDLNKLDQKKCTLSLGGHGAFKYFFIAAIE